MSSNQPDKKTSGHAVVVLGSLHYDIMLEAPHRPVKGETVTGTRWYPKFGGKGGNQAIAANFHGADVRLVSATGIDNFADYLRARLSDANLSTTFVEQLDNTATGMSVAIQDSDGDYGAVIVSGANLAISPSTLENPAIWQNAALLLLQNEVPEALNIVAAKKARSLGLTVCLNAAPAREMSTDLLAMVDILIVNGVEAEALGCSPIDSLNAAGLAAEQLSQQFPCVIVTAGGDGVAACSDTVTINLPAKPIEVVSTHGAGDVFCGVLCAELARQTDLESAIQVANDCAADHVATIS